jgi:pimeloyl-ACP methyl ester carboxylesterase
MPRVKVNDVELSYQVRGTGEAVLLIHGAHIADALRPLVAQPALAQHQTIQYHRRGYALSSRAPGPTTAEDHTVDAVALLDHLGVERAHVIGHSYGAMIALTLAAAHPARVRSLVLIEPPDLRGLAGAALMEMAELLAERYRNGDPAGAVNGFLELISPDWRTIIDASVPGGIKQAENDAATFFEIELAGIGSWTFGAEQARAIACPVLSVNGTASGPLFDQGRDQLHAWLPQCRDLDINEANHFLPMERPKEIATAIADFVHTAPVHVLRKIARQGSLATTQQYVHLDQS